MDGISKFKNKQSSCYKNIGKKKIEGEIGSLDIDIRLPRER